MAKMLLRMSDEYNDDIALRKYDEIEYELINQLSTYPEKFSHVENEEMKNAGFRRMVIAPYVAFYRIGDRVIIYRVLHGAMNLPRLYADMIADIKK